MQAGQKLIVNLAVPNEAPENQLADGQLPVVLLISPDLRVTVIKATMRVPIQPELGLDVLLLHTFADVAVAGNYSIVVTGNAPSRFALACRCLRSFASMRPAS